MVKEQRGIVLGRPENLTHNHDLGRQRSMETRSNRADKRAQDVLDSTEYERQQGAQTLREIATRLNTRNIPTVSGKGEWTPRAVKRVIDRVAAA